MTGSASRSVTLAGLGVRFEVPTLTAQGSPIVMDDARLHFRSVEDRDFYFEVTRRLGAGVHDSYVQERSFMEERFSGAQVSDLKEMQLQGEPAYAFDLAWDGGRRRILLIERGGALYRIVYDPTTPLSEQALDSVRFEE